MARCGKHLEPFSSQYQRAFSQKKTERTSWQLAAGHHKEVFPLSLEVFIFSAAHGSYHVWVKASDRLYVVRVAVGAYDELGRLKNDSVPGRSLDYVAEKMCMTGIDESWHLPIDKDGVRIILLG